MVNAERYEDAKLYYFEEQWRTQFKWLEIEAIPIEAVGKPVGVVEYRDFVCLEAHY